MKITIKSFNVAGVQFRPANVIDPLQTGDEIRLETEPTNPYDKFAIKILHGENHIGFVPKKETWIYHLLRKAGVKITLDLFVNHDARDEDKLLVIAYCEGDENNQF